MEKPIIAYCGINCSQCDSYLATQANDEDWKARLVKEWGELYHNPNIDAAYVTCDGCLQNGGQLGGHCKECGIRACAIKHGVVSCADCAEFENCTEIAGFMQMVPEAKATLEALRRG